ncbi:hypothetical protein C7444_11235 [Sphaerotilus hippei]|uniref:Outer membrane beta-barrel porin/alpha-amylase n=1 Tax=Sphaerotilus hippei TaxID=744406 RepID=A0A318GXZ1_9BURK|nr:hypothetical protein [Sphaerotilus hippei]PXW94720.1 hypothetical protein C7444_11235 [Sphaerotilus hippei]
MNTVRPSIRTILPTRLPRALVALAGICCVATTHAADIGTVQQLDQREFRLLSEDLGAALSYKPLIPTAPLGTLGFDVGVAVSGTVLEHRDLLKKAAGGGSVPGTLPLASVRLDKGLPWNFDVAVAVGQVPGSNIETSGAELRWAFIPGDVLVPAVAVRAAYTRLSGVDQLQLRTSSVDLSVSKGFLLFTPYAGIGVVQVHSQAQGIATLQKERFNLNKVFVGANLNLGLINVAVEGDRTGKNTSYGVKAGLRF